MKKIFICLLFIPLIAIAQSKEKLTFEKLNKELHDYLSKNDELYIVQNKNHKITDGSISIMGIHNYDSSKTELIDGVYAFSMNITMAKVYLVLIEGNEFKILDFRTRENLDKSLVSLLDFCDKHKYCEKITTDYVSRMVRAFYNLNKWENQRADLNCEDGRGINDIKKLP